MMLNGPNPEGSGELHEGISGKQFHWTTKLKAVPARIEHAILITLLLQHNGLAEHCE